MATASKKASKNTPTKYGSIANVRIVSSIDDWSEVEEEFLGSMGSIEAVGLDCEWVIPKTFEMKEHLDKTRREFDDRVDELRKANVVKGKASLLQLSTSNGFVILVRLCLFDRVPPSLKELLEDEQIVKFGVNIENDVKRLFTEWGVLVTSFVDVRNVVGENRDFLINYTRNGLGLKNLGAYFETGDNSTFNKTPSIKYSHWAAYQLSYNQIQYAANDARLGIQCVIGFVAKYLPGMTDHTHPDFWPRLRLYVENHINRPCAPHLLNDMQGCEDEEADFYADDPVAAKKEMRLRMAKKKFELDDSSSDVELDFDGWHKQEEKRKWSRLKKIKEQEDQSRSCFFYSKDGEPTAAIDVDFMRSLNDDSDEDDETRVVFDVESVQGEFEVKMKLKRVK